MLFVKLLIVCILGPIPIADSSEAPAPWVHWVKKRKASYQGPYGTPVTAHFTYFNDKRNKVHLDLETARFHDNCGHCLATISQKKSKIILSLNSETHSLELDKPFDLPGYKNLSVKASRQREGLRLSVFDRVQKNLKKKRLRKFFDYQSKGIVHARWSPYSSAKKITMSRSNNSKLPMLAYGELKWSMKGEDHSLTLYDYGLDLAEFKKSREHMLIFRDLSNGKSTYGAGRFVMIQTVRPFQDWKPGEKILINFNYSFKPPCSVSAGFQCPLPQDLINQEILVGEKHTKIEP